MSLALKRLESDSFRELSLFFSREASKEILNLCNVTEVRITRDLSYMTIYYTCIDPHRNGELKKALEENNGYIRKELCSKIHARKMPELIFKFDEALAYGNHINEILSTLDIKHDDEEEK